MRRTILCGFAILGVLQAQSQPAGTGPPSQEAVSQEGVPIYRVRVVGRTTKAVNYRRGGVATPIDFRGTVLLPDAEGSAMVKANKGSTEIRTKFKKLPAPTRFGREYLTYVLWAITPEGRATNLGEIYTDNDNDGKLNVTSDLQAFAMIVTAEPYFSVTQPSDVVVMENAINRDTAGRIELVDASYELLKRGEYSYDTEAAQAETGRREKLPMHRYEALLAVYQAQNAIQIAQSLGAERHAAETIAKAQRLLLTARQYYDNKSDSKTVIQTARQAAQTAEDARLITIARQEREDAEARAAIGQPAEAVSQ
jgi:hypothetical protein